MDKESKALVGSVPDEKTEEWKKKYKSGVYAIMVDGHIAYFKNPGRHELNCAMAKADKDSTLAMYEELANLTFIGGSEAVLNDDQMFLGICQELHQKLEGKKATLVNL